MSKLLSFDGIYRTEWIWDEEDSDLGQPSGTYHYLKFNEDGTVLILTSTEPIGKILSSLKKQNIIPWGNIPQIHYAVQDSSIEFRCKFAFESMYLMVDTHFIGQINNGWIDMEIINNRNNMKSVFKYYFFRTDEYISSD